MAHADKTTFTTRAAETRPPGKHAVGGRSGLWLVVSPTGARRWLVRVVVDGKRREMSLGSFPAVGLKEAKDKALDAQRLAKAGRDPIAERNKSNRIEASMPTFTSCAAHFIKAHRRGWSNRKHARQWVSTLTAR